MLKPMSGQNCLRVLTDNVGRMPFDSSQLLWTYVFSMFFGPSDDQTMCFIQICASYTGGCILEGGGGCGNRPWREPLKEDTVQYTLSAVC